MHCRVLGHHHAVARGNNSPARKIILVIIYTDIYFPRDRSLPLGAYLLTKYEQSLLCNCNLITNFRIKACRATSQTRNPHIYLLYTSHSSRISIFACITYSTYCPCLDSVAQSPLPLPLLVLPGTPNTRSNGRSPDFGTRKPHQTPRCSCCAAICIVQSGVQSFRVGASALPGSLHQCKAHATASADPACTCNY